MTLRTSSPSGARWRSRLGWLGLALVLVLMGFAVSRVWHRTAAWPVYDWVLYWSGGRLALEGQNPYDPQKVFRFQKEEVPDLQPQDTILFYNPPWSLPVLMPFALLPGFAVFRLVWGLLLLAVLFFCSERVWTFYGGPPAYRWLGWLVAFTFYPTLNVLQTGQIGPLVLFGLVGFLALERRGHGWAAGAVAVLATLKPQLAFLFWLALLFWAVDRRRWSVLLGGLLTGLAAAAVPMLNNPRVFLDYWEVMTLYSPAQQFMSPTLGSLLRIGYLQFGPGDDLVLLQYVPTVVALVAIPFYYLRHRQRWDWAEQMPVLIFASFLTTPYGAWLVDMVVLLLPVLQATVWLAAGRHRLTAGVMAAVHLTVTAVAWWLSTRAILTVWFVWVPPLLLVLYLLLRRQHHRDAQSDTPAGSRGQRSEVRGRFLHDSK